MTVLPDGVVPVGVPVGLTFSNKEPKTTAFVGNSAFIELSKVLSAVNGVLHPSQLGFISGIITVKGEPAPNRRVFLHYDSGAYVSGTFSDESGNYRFDGLVLGRRYTITAHDNETYQYAPVGADRRTPEAYP